MLTTVVLAGAVGVISAAPAQASAAECEKYLSQWYNVGPKVKEACAVADSPWPVREVACRGMLIDLGVSSARAFNACRMAGE
ncbi:hypothetical protein [Streptomyces carpaticus]|uniref:hypothetical protein n=1 Tax=Streptomyces carpaticus TaxID=285558 RepID=UPI0031F9FFAE